MARWLWKIAEGLAAGILVVFLLVPFYLEKDLVKDFYSTRPALCVGSFAMYSVLGIEDSV
jgi:hypothetical protein